jgi:uncharacterized cupin superfamily protein
MDESQTATRSTIDHDGIWLMNVADSAPDPITFRQVPIGGVQTIRETIRFEHKLWVGIWEVPAMEILDFAFPADETFYILSGRFRIERKSDGKVFNLGPGDIVSFDVGQHTDLYIEEDAKIFFVDSQDPRLVWPG